MLHTRMTVVTSILITMIVVTSCSKKGADQIYGEWMGDPESMMADEKFKKMPPRPEAAESAARMLKAISMTITRDTVTAQVNQNKLTTRYKVVSATGNKIVVEILDGNRKGTKTTFSIIDKNRIAITDERNPAILYLKRK